MIKEVTNPMLSFSQRIYKRPSGRNFARYVHLLSASALLVSCVSIRVEYLADETYPSREHAASVEWLSAEPSEPYIKIARIVADSTSGSQETLRQAILDRARRLGADAVIDEKAATVSSRAPSPNYERGVLGPAGASFDLYGYGHSTPYAPAPYLLSQGATDQPRLDEYLSGMAIRFSGSPRR